MIEIICLIVGGYLGFRLGSAFALFKLKDLILREAARQGLDVDVLEKNIIEKQHNKLVIEYNDNMLYLYENDTNTFICQAKTVEELAKLAKEYKNISNAEVFDKRTSNIMVFSDGKVV